MLLPLFLVSSNNLVMDPEAQEVLFEAPEGLMSFFQWCLVCFTGNPLYACMWAVLGFGFLFCIIRRVIEIVT